MVAPESRRPPAGSRSPAAREAQDDAVAPVIRRTPDAVAHVARGVPPYEVAAATPDPEMPTVTIEDLGILRGVDYSPGGEVVVTITPTYSGCPAMREIGLDVRDRLTRAGFARVTVRTQLSPPWTTDWITPEGRRKLAAVGIAPPPQARAAGAGETRGPGMGRRCGAIPLTLGQPPSSRCPRCGSLDTRLTAQFGTTACKSLHRCNACGEPFEAVKAL
jgi:ring-1,2-phenylacetyl-CoA epoxidase subunit PaaD